MGSGGCVACPAVSGRIRLSAAVRAEYVLKSGPGLVAEGGLDPLADERVAAVEALRVDLEQDLDGVAGPLGDRARRHAPVQPGPYLGMAQAVGRAPQRSRRDLGVEHLPPRPLPCS